MSNAAAGSVWNSGSYFWEEKDYGKWAQSRLLEIVGSLPIAFNSQPVELKNTTPKGFASISVRKGKKIVTFEYEVSADWTCGCSSGKLTIPEFNQDDLNPPIRVTLLSGDEACKEAIRKSTSILSTALQQFAKELSSSEGSSESLEADKQRRDEERQRAVQAEAEKGEEKRRIAAEIKAAEIKPIVEAHASVWNVNAYHWETKRMEKPAKEWLETELTTLGFNDIKIDGEAEVSIRKGKKIVVFDLKLEAKEFSVSSFNNSDEIRVTWKSGENRSSDVKGVLGRLEEELRSRG